MLNFKCLKLNYRGFTLVELIVVMAILAILAALAVPRVTEALNRAKVDVNNTNITVIENAAELYYYQTNKEASSIDDLLDAGYLKENPRDPFTGAENAYQIKIENGSPVAVLIKDPTE